MNSIELIRALPEERTSDFLTALNWLNPLPAQAHEVSDKIKMALQIAAFSTERSGENKQSHAAINSATLLKRLKRDIDFILTLEHLDQRDHQSDK